MKKELAELEKERRILLKRLKYHIDNRIYCNCLQNRIYILEKDIADLRKSIANRRFWKNGIFKTLFGGLKWKIWRY